MRLLITLFILFSANIHGLTYTIKVTNLYNNPIEGATVRIQSEQDTDNSYEGITNSEGILELDINISDYYEGELEIKNAYPNPFNSEILIWYNSNEEGNLVLNIYDLNGRKVFFKEIDYNNTSVPYFIWDGRSNDGREAGNGLYLIELRSGRRNSSKLVYKNDKVSSVVGSIPGEISDSSFINKEQFTIKIESAGYEDVELNNYSIHTGNNHTFCLPSHITIPFKTGKNYFKRWNGDFYDSIFIKGINLGVSIPNTLPGELAASSEQYENWINKIAESGFNSIRVYTLHYPKFYDQLFKYNITHPERPLYVFHGAWLDEIEGDNYDLYLQTEDFNEEIVRVINCVHGNNEIPETQERLGKATGKYTSDISPWVIGYIVGREIHPNTILKTNSENAPNNSFTGIKLSLPSGSPTEVWLTARMNSLLEYEDSIYDCQRPVAFSNWPTLDPLTHPTEMDYRSTEDTVGVDLANINFSNAPAGIFASYHAYPYFPDFISEDPVYRTYSDSVGPNSYLGYINDLKNHYKDMPLLIAEFGVPTSWGNAHFAFSGMEHGAMTEEQQGNFALRMLHNFDESGCAGGLLFSWIDEWFKNSWITTYFDSEPVRRPLWNNKLNPEQNFGLLAFEENPERLLKSNRLKSKTSIDKTEIFKDNSYLFINLTLSKALSDNDTLFIAFDTYDRNLGESTLPNGKIIENRAEFLLQLTNSNATHYVTEAYDLFAIWHGESGPEQQFHSVKTDGFPWKIFRIKNNSYADWIHYVGILKVNEENNLNAVTIENNKINIRIPWGMLHFTDPSKMEVMDDNKNTSEREVRISDGIILTIISGENEYITGKITWDTWNEVFVTERKKKSLKIISDRIGDIGF